MVNKMSKSIFASWTFWFGVAQIVYGLIGMASGALEHSEGITLLMTGFGSIGLRIRTTKPVSL